MQFYKWIFTSRDDVIALGFITLVFVPPLLMDLIARYLAR